MDHMSITDLGIIGAALALALTLARILERVIADKMMGRPKDSDGNPIDRRATGLTEGERAALYGTKAGVDKLAHTFLREDETGANRCLKTWATMADHQERTATMLDLVAKHFEDELKKGRKP